MKVRNVRQREHLAIDPAALRSGRESMFFLMGPPPPPENTYDDGIACVYIHGALEHHDTGCGDSYEAIIKRVDEALAEEGTRAIVLRIDSPGGVVSGLNETVKKLRALDVPLYAYLDEMAASAAYALACGCEEIYIPPSGIAGSIGVISTMCDETAADKASGLKFVTLTSGERKADGNPHTTISQEAIDAEQTRVDELAAQFFALVSTSRGLSIKTVRGFQAGVFLGREAVRSGLADGVMSFGALVEQLAADLADEKEVAQPADLGSSSTRQPTDRSANPGAAKMAIKLNALIAKYEALAKSEKDTKKRAALTMKLEAYKKTKRSLEEETEEFPEKDDDDGDKDKDSEDDEPKKDAEDEDDDADAKKASDEDAEDAEDATDAEDDGPKKDSKKSKKAAKAEDDDGEDKPEKEEKKAQAVLSLIRGAVGGMKPGAVASLLQKAAAYDLMQPRLATIEATNRKATRQAAIDGALAQRRITKHEAKNLASKKLSFVEEYLAMRPNAIINTDEDDLLSPDDRSASANGLSREVMDQIEQAVAHGGNREALIKANKARMNGAKPGAY